MRVRATQDGVYAGYYYHGPIMTENGDFPGAVFEIDDKIYPALDERGRPVMEVMQDANGDPIIEKVEVQMVNAQNVPIADDKGKPIMTSIEKPKLQPKTWTWFSPTWMEKVPANTPITYDLPPFEIPLPYRESKKRVEPQAEAPTSPTAVPQQGKTLAPVI